MILIQSQPVFALSPLCYTFSGEATNTNLWTFIRPDRGSNPQLTALGASTNKYITNAVFLNTYEHPVTNMQN